MTDLIVNYYSGYTCAEEPRSFEWEGVKYDIARIERAWRELGEKHFRVCTGDNKLFQLCYNETKDQWSITEVVRSR